MAKKILIVDDEPDFITPIIGILEIFEINRNDIIYCAQIDEAFRALEKEDKNIGCMSLDMLIADPLGILKGAGEINGLKALKQLSHLYPWLPIACFTILREQEGGIREAVEENKATFISKTDSDSVERLIEFFKKYYV